ncbi:Ankyrin repeats (3 copies) [Candidatus Arcanobacter lacustris]|uniref:Ankyrin repeats (3 copies) n=1 Tax=Candidatus Arcanibacter lacustris TaxID=1607817 RepID=A0A0F5MQ17_9RICK|nr:Ankyrin repeats (3 copies) [Candidatus Arcanobacter lacustris]
MSDVVKKIIANGADLNALIDQDDKIVTQIQDGNKYGISLNQGETPLCTALRAQHWGVAKALIEGGANLDIVGIKAGNKDYTPLAYCIIFYPELVETLLKKGADTNMKFSDNHYPIMVAAELSNIGTLLKNKGSEDESTVRERFNKFTSYKIFEKLILHGADINVVDNQGDYLDSYLQDNGIISKYYKIYLAIKESGNLDVAKSNGLLISNAENSDINLADGLNMVFDSGKITVFCDQSKCKNIDSLNEEIRPLLLLGQNPAESNSRNLIAEEENVNLNTENNNADSLLNAKIQPLFLLYQYPEESNSRNLIASGENSNANAENINVDLDKKIIIDNLVAHFASLTLVPAIRCLTDTVNGKNDNIQNCVNYYPKFASEYGEVLARGMYSTAIFAASNFYGLNLINSMIASKSISDFTILAIKGDKFETGSYEKYSIEMLEYLATSLTVVTYDIKLDAYHMALRQISPPLIDLGSSVIYRCATKIGDVIYLTGELGLGDFLDLLNINHP